MANPVLIPSSALPPPPTSSGAYSYAKLRALWIQAGGNPDMASTMAAIALAESGGKVGALNNNANTGDYSVGLWQINYYGDMRKSRTASFGTPEKLQSDPLANARAAVALAAGGSGLSNWTTFTSGAYQAFFSPQTPQEKAANDALLAQAKAGNANYIAQTTNLSVEKSNAVAIAKAAQGPWVTLVNGKFGTAYGEPPKTAVMWGGEPVAQSQLTQAWNATYGNTFEAFTGRTATPTEIADVLKRGISVYGLQGELAGGKTFTASPVWKSKGAGISDQAEQVLGVAPPQEFVRRAIAENWTADETTAQLKKLPQFVKGPVYKQSALAMRGTYQSIYGQIPKADPANPDAPTVQGDIHQHILAGWTPQEYAMKLRAQPQYKNSPEAKASALHFLDGMGLLTGSRPTLAAGAKGAPSLPGAPGAV